MSQPPPNILVVDDERPRLDGICRGLSLYGYRCRGVSSADAALDALASDADEPYDLVLTDLPGRSGPELVERILALRPGLQIVVVTGLGATSDAEALRRMSVPLLAKPFDPETLDATLRSVLRGAS